jgi:hypothetical protein
MFVVLSTEALAHTRMERITTDVKNSMIATGQAIEGV